MLPKCIDLELPKGRLVSGRGFIGFLNVWLPGVFGRNKPSGTNRIHARWYHPARKVSRIIVYVFVPLYTFGLTLQADRDIQYGYFACELNYKNPK